MASSTKWPLTEKRTAKVGQTIKNSLVKPKPAGTKSKKVERDFHSVSFRPTGLDSERPASLESTPYKDDQGSVSKIVLERPIANKEDVHVFEGVEKPMQTEYDCVLIWDESLQTLTLERVDTQINLTHKGQRPPTKRTSSNSPASTPMPEPLISASLAVHPVKREADGNGEAKLPVKPTPPPKRPMPFQGKAKPAAGTTASSLSQTLPTSSPSASSSTAAKPKPRPVKRADPPTANPPRSPPKPYGGLQLPTADSFAGIVPALASALPATVSQTKPESTPFAVPAQSTEVDEDDEDDMEEVEPDETHFSPLPDNPPTPVPEPTLAAPEPPVRAFSSSFVMEEEGDDEEIFDDAAFAAEMEMEMNMEGEGEGEDEEDDDDMEAVEPDSAPAGPPLSINAYVGAVEDDEYSSSDDD